MIEAARGIGRVHGYFGHLARLALLEVEWAPGQGDRARAERAADDAHHSAGNYNAYLQRDTDLRLQAMGVPRGSTGHLPAAAR